MIEFISETLLLLPFLFVTYLVLEAIEAHAGGVLDRFRARGHNIGPLAGAVAGAVPQCGMSVAASSLYAGGVISVGTLIAVFLSTSDELIPVLISKQVPVSLLVKILGIKAISAIAVGFSLNALCSCLRLSRRRAKVQDLCAQSHCCCHQHGEIFVPAIVHTTQIFFFIVVVSGLIEIFMHCFGENCLESLRLNVPVFGEMVGGLIGLIPNCAVSVASAELYCKGAISAGALMASAFTGSGLGMLALFRTNRSLKENMVILVVVYLIGVLLGMATGPLI